MENEEPIDYLRAMNSQTTSKKPNLVFLPTLISNGTWDLEKMVVKFEIYHQRSIMDALKFLNAWMEI